MRSAMRRLLVLAWVMLGPFALPTPAWATLITGTFTFEVTDFTPFLTT